LLDVCRFLESAIELLFNDTVKYNGTLNARYKFDSSRNGTTERVVSLGICNKRITKSVAVNSITESSAVISLDTVFNSSVNNSTIVSRSRTTDSVVLLFNVNGNSYSVTLFSRGNVVISCETTDVTDVTTVFMFVKELIHYDDSVQIKKKKYKKRVLLTVQV